jgi:hypothetical protein
MVQSAKTSPGHSGLPRLRYYPAGKYEFTNFSIPGIFWQYSFNATYTQSRL